MSDTNGYVPTPACVADYMAEWLFTYADTEPGRILYPGLGTGNLHDAVTRYCTRNNRQPPDGVAVELNQELIDTFHADHPDTSLDVRHADFLLDPPNGSFDFVIANPPYIPYRAISEQKRDQYRDRYSLATGQFKTQHLFFEQALDLLDDDGWLVFLTPYKFLCFDSDKPLRTRIRQERPQAFLSLPRPIFPNHTVDTVVSVIHGSSDTTVGDSLWIEPIHPDTYDTFATALDFPDDIWPRYKKGLNSKQRSVRATAERETNVTQPKSTTSTPPTNSQPSLEHFTSD